MIRFTLRQVAATLILAASASLLPLSAGEAPPYVSKPYTVPAKGVPEPVRKAVQSTDRPPQHVQRDGWRRPAEILALSGVRPGQRVVEFSPYGLYYSTLLSSVVGEKGTVHMYEFPHVGEQFGESTKTWAAAHPNTRYEILDFNRIEFPRNVDLFFNVLAYHDMLLINVDLDAFHAKVFKAMKPGAIYLIIDHASRHGVGTDDISRLHRVDPGVVRAGVQSAGFELVEDSRLLENHSDDHTWPIFADGKRDQTDQMVYKFRKPVVY